MNGADWDRIKYVFHEVVNGAPLERMARARQLCGADRALLAEVESLLAAHQNAGGFAERPAEELLDALSSIDSTNESISTVGSALHAGDRLGVYEIESLLGVGGMGEVYRARDTRLDRSVAIKVLRTSMGADQRARERFDREARAVAALSHPHICTLHDIGHQDGIDFLVMEHLVGETLAARLSRGPLPVEQAIDVAIQIVSALDGAHRAGIVHRDLKPGNIFLAQSSSSRGLTAKLLDFGLAKTDAVARFDSSPGLHPQPQLTLPGAMLGTVAYMAPEQLAGHNVGARADLFAFGAVIYEAITGRRAFEGASEAHVIAAILEHEPRPLSAVQRDAPAFLERIVNNCLAKDPEDRWQTARDLLIALTWLRDGDATPPVPMRAPVRLRALVVGAAIAGLASLAVYSWPRRDVVPAPSVSFSVYPPQGTKFPRGAAEIAIAPDGRRLAFVALSSDGTRRIWIRTFDSVVATAIEGTDGASYPFWSPDGHAVAFFAHGKLKRISEAGGSPEVLCDIRLGARGGNWSPNGTILYSSFGAGLWRVAEAGGVPTPATTLDASRKERAHSFPVFLPDGRRFLYLAQSDDREHTAVYQGVLGSTNTRRVFTAESNVGLSGTQLLSLSKGALMAQEYDADRAQVVGQPTTVAERIVQDNPLRSGGSFAAGARTVLAYRSASPDSHLIWFDRTGKRVEAFDAPGDYQHPWMSPDEKQIAVEKTDPATGRHTIWILDLSRAVTWRLVSDAAGAHGPVWSPDGKRVVFASNRLGGIDLYSIPVDGTAADELVISSSEGDGLGANDWSPDGRLLLYQATHRGQVDLRVLSMSPGAKPEPFLATAANERQGQFSPDLRWIAYTSDESGAHEVYVQRFPGGGGKWQVSTHGGAQPRWRRDGKELFYLAPDGNLMAAVLDPRAATFATLPPRALFNTGITASFVDRRNQYVVAQSGQRFLVNLSDDDDAPITVVLTDGGTRK